MTTPTIWKTQRISSAPWLRAILLAAPLITLVLLPDEFADPQGSPWLLLAVFAFMAICMWPLAFAAHWVEGDDDALRIRYWPILSRTVSYARIASVEYRPSVSPWEFGGIGLRFEAVLAFANRKGPGVGLRTQDGRAYFVILKDADELTEIRDHIERARRDLRPEDERLR